MLVKGATCALALLPGVPAQVAVEPPLPELLQPGVAGNRQEVISSINAIKLLFLPDCVLWFQFQEIVIKVRDLIAVYFDADASWRL